MPGSHRIKSKEGEVGLKLNACLQMLSGQPKAGVTAWAYGIFTVSQTISPLLPLAVKDPRSPMSRLKCFLFPRYKPTHWRSRVFCSWWLGRP